MLFYIKEHSHMTSDLDWKLHKSWIVTQLFRSVITTDCVYKDGKYRQSKIAHKPLNLGHDWWAWSNKNDAKYC